MLKRFNWFFRWSRGIGPSPGVERRESADKPGSVVDSHSSGMCVTAHLVQPTREPCGPHAPRRSVTVPLFGLAPGGVYPATPVTWSAVRSYRTISPLPAPRKVLRRYLFCGTFRRLAPPRRYLAPCPVEPGLSSVPESETATVWSTPDCNLSLFSHLINRLSGCSELPEEAAEPTRIGKKSL